MFSYLKLFIFICGFSAKVNCAFLAYQTNSQKRVIFHIFDQITRLQGYSCKSDIFAQNYVYSPFKLVHSPLVCDDHDQEDGQRHGDVVERIEHLDTEGTIKL